MLISSNYKLEQEKKDTSEAVDENLLKEFIRQKSCNGREEQMKGELQ